MNPGETAALQAELLDDFYAECDEHLSNIRTQLLAAEQASSGGRFDRAALDSCFRSMHSFKGNAAIVGLHSAEQIAHGAEGLLRGLLRDGSGPEDGLQLLGGSVQRLEQIVTAHRLKQPLPEIADTLAALSLYLPDPAAARPVTPETHPDANAIPAPLSPTEKMADVERRGLSPWRCVFSPSPELDRRGVNINAVRARLSGLGEIVSAIPSIGANGSMRFEFLLGLHDDPADPGAWADDGMCLERAGTSRSAAAALSAPPAAPPLSGSASLFMSPSHIVRVDLSRLDELMRITGEMVIHRSRLEARIARLTGDRTALQETALALGRSLRELREALTRVRLVPVAEIFSRMPFVVRDLARDSGKRVNLVLEGQHTEIDKYLVERLKEPLLHLVRNAISHGVEPASERARNGKAEEATLLLRAEAVGHSIVIHVRDDGRGVDRQAIVDHAATAGLAVPDSPDDHDILDLLCSAGFSTREEADRASGRGMGMTVVQGTVRELGGTLSLESTPGRSTEFTLRLPLTLSIAETFIVTAAGHTCAVPQESVGEVRSLNADDVTTIHGVEVVRDRDGVLPLIRLAGLFQAAPGTVPHPPTLVLNTERGSIGLVVDRVIGKREVVVRAIHDPLIQVPGISGATELGDGHPVLIIDPTALAARLSRRAAASAAPRVPATLPR